MRLCYARLPLDGVADKALAIATALLDASADPDAGWTDGSNRFPALAGIIGGGDAGQSAHPAAERLAHLLIARGADPFAPQALYNTSLGPDSTFWLDLLWLQSQLRGETNKWTGPAPTELGGEKAKSALSYLLGNAVPDQIERARWLLEHGAESGGINFYSRAPLIKHALLAGRDDVADLLERHGAHRPLLTDDELFMAAVAIGDLDAMRRLAWMNPQFLARHEAMFSAIRLGRTDVAEALIQLGMSPDIGDDENCCALHCCAKYGAVDIGRMLIARGAEIDPFDLRHGGTPLTHATHNGQAGMVALLAAHSRNFRGLCFAGAVERLGELLGEGPDRANREDRPGEPALFCLPNDSEKAVEVAELLLSFGANAKFHNPLGQTPAQAARRRGLDDAAALLDWRVDAGRIGARTSASGSSVSSVIKQVRPTSGSHAPRDRRCREGCRACLGPVRLDSVVFERDGRLIGPLETLICPTSEVLVLNSDIGFSRSFHAHHEQAKLC